MQVEEIVQLVGSGNFNVPEQEWMNVVERPDVRAESFSRLEPVLDAVISGGQTELAESMAWAAVEALKEKGSPREALDLGKNLFLKLAQSGDLRDIIEQLYRQVYADRPNLETLLAEAGISGGRPPRRAVRTLDTCLELRPGSYLVGRHEETAARVDSIDDKKWRVTVSTGRATQTLDPVEFADKFAIADDGDFRVLLAFDTNRLRELAAGDPGTLVENIVRARGGKLNSDELEHVVTSGMVDPGDWTKWWGKARAALKKNPHVKIDGRSPYVLEYVAQADSLEQEFETHFSKIRSPEKQWEAIENYLRDCRSAGRNPDTAMLERLRELTARRSKRMAREGGTAALSEWLVEWNIGQIIGTPDADKPAIDLLAQAEDPAPLIRACETPALWSAACDCLEKARPSDWADVLLSLFPRAPLGTCEDLAARLARAGVSHDRIEKLTAEVLSDAVNNYAALFWLWDKGLSQEPWSRTPALTVLTRILWVLAQAQLDESIPSPTVRDIRGAARSTLSARKYERFIECLSDIESGMASALRTQIQRLDNLGRNVHEDLLNRIRSKFPALWVRAAVPIWAQEDAIVSTEKGIARWSADIQELVNVKMRENARAIGEAAEKGDLSENSEYKFALEERDLLRARLANMQEQMAIARRILPEQVPEDHISVGAKVSFRHVESGDPFQATFLGPFEASAENNIYNYKSPIGQELMGKRIGEQVNLPMANPPGNYEIVAIQSWEPA